jgi:hypothetical protein
MPMSVRVMSAVWQAKLTGPVEKIVLLALADHASDDGGNIYPSVPTLAEKCNVTDRHVRRVIKRMIANGVLVHDGHVKVSHGWVNRYRISLQALQPLTHGQATPDTRSVTPDTRSGKPSLTINEPSAPTAFADRAGSAPDVNEGLTPAEIGEGGTMTIVDSTKKLDPIEHMFKVATSGDRNERLLMRAKGSQPAKDFAIEFYRATNIPVIRAAEWLTGAQMLHEATGGDWSIAAEALKRLRVGGRVTISSPHSLIKTAAAIRGERASKPAPEVGVVYVPVFN